MVCHNFGLYFSQNWMLPSLRVNEYDEKSPSTLANLTLIILFSEMLEFSNFISSKSKTIVKFELQV
jgi:hypothetical protein